MLACLLVHIKMYNVVLACYSHQQWLQILSCVNNSRLLVF